MKKLLIISGSFAIISGASLSVVSCKTKDNETYNSFKTTLGKTKGTYDKEGNPITKSGAAVIYFGARDNASSQSFEAAMKDTFGPELKDARQELSKPWETVTISAPFNFNATNAQLLDNSLTITNLDDPALDKLDHEADYVQLTLGGVKFDATIIKTSDPLSLQITPENKDKDLEKFKKNLREAFDNATQPSNSGQKLSVIKTYKIKKEQSTFASRLDFYAQWVASYQKTWMERTNADRGVKDVKMQLREKSNYYGAILEQPFITPTYGVKNNGELGIYAPITVGLDYIQPQLDFQYFNVDKVGNYWNSDLFSKLSNYLKEDILYQLGANNPIDSNGSEAVEKNIPQIKKRVDTANKIVDKFKEVKGPLFLFVKNGHVIDARRGWNRYQEFGGKDDMKKARYHSDLLSWAKEMGFIWSQSTLANLNGIATDGILGWGHVTADDKGAENWDWVAKKPKE